MLPYLTLFTLGTTGHGKSRTRVMFGPLVFETASGAPGCDLWQTPLVLLDTNPRDAALACAQRKVWGYPETLTDNACRHLGKLPNQGHGQHTYLFQRILRLRDFPGSSGNGIWYLPLAGIEANLAAFTPTAAQLLTQWSASTGRNLTGLLNDWFDGIEKVETAHRQQRR